MGKSLGNYIGVGEPAYEMVKKFMQIPDASMSMYFELLTDLPPDDVSQLLAGHPKQAKMTLARTIVGEYHEFGPGTFHADTKTIPDWAQIPGVPSWTRYVIRDRLEECGFDVEMSHEAEHIGKFFAVNKRYSEAKAWEAS